MKPEEVSPAIGATREDGPIFLIVLKSRSFKQEVGIRATDASVSPKNPKTLIVFFGTETIAYVPIAQIARII